MYRCIYILYVDSVSLGCIMNKMYMQIYKIYVHIRYTYIKSVYNLKKRRYISQNLTEIPTHLGSMISACNFAQSFFFQLSWLVLVQGRWPNCTSVVIKGPPKKKHSNNRNLFPIENLTSEKKKQPSQADFLNRPHKQTT